MSNKATLNFGRAAKEVLEAMANGDYMTNRVVYNSVRKLIDAMHKQDENSKVESKGRVAPYDSNYFGKLAEQVDQLLQEFEKGLSKQELAEIAPIDPNKLPELNGFSRRRARLSYKCDGSCGEGIPFGAVHFSKGKTKLCPQCYIKVTNAKERG